jgi:hypothetical protein
VVFSRLGVKFAIFLGLFSHSAWASTIYRLPLEAGEHEEIARHQHPLPDVERVFRVINLTDGAPFSSFNSEFILKGGELKRVRSQKVNHVTDMMLERISENLICEKNLTAGVVTGYIGPGQAWRERTVGPIDHQALQEMSSRQYLDPEQATAYANSTNLGDADRMIYFESLSWLSAREILDVFDGKIPWARISEVEAPEGLGSIELRKLAESGDVRIRLRLRRATFRVVASHVYQMNESKGLAMYEEPLPFEIEYRDQGIDLPNDANEILYRFELGRASQIPGFEGEAEQLSALAGLAMWHHSMSFEDFRTGYKSDIREVDANVYMHALKRTHHILYSGRFGATEFARGKKPHDVTLRMSLKAFLAKTLPSLGLSAEKLREIAVKADSMEAMRLDLDWMRGTQNMTRYHPVTIRLSRKFAAHALESFARDVTDSRLKEKWIKASLDAYDQIAGFQFPETRTVDPYKHDKHSRMDADYFVSGLDLWSATSPVYAPAFMAVLAKFFKGVHDDVKIAVIVAQTPGGDRDLLHQLVHRGFEFVPMAPDDLDNHNGPFVARITVKRLQEAAQKFPEIANEMKHETALKSATWRSLRDISLLPGL